MNCHVKSEASRWKLSESWSVLWFGGHFVFGRFFCNLFGLSIWTSMQNLDSVAQAISELGPVLWFGGQFVFGDHFFAICSVCPYELPYEMWSL